MLSSRRKSHHSYYELLKSNENTDIKYSYESNNQMLSSNDDD